MDLGVHLVDLALWTLDFPAIEGEVAAELFAGGAPLTGNAVEDFAVAQLRLTGGTAVRLACSWQANAGRDAVIEASFYGTAGGASLRNVGGSFYDFAAERYRGTQTEALAGADADWGGRAAAAWARALAASPRFHPAAERLVNVAAVLDRIYAAG